MVAEEAFLTENLEGKRWKIPRCSGALITFRAQPTLSTNMNFKSAIQVLFKYYKPASSAPLHAERKPMAHRNPVHSMLRLKRVTL